MIIVDKDTIKKNRSYNSHTHVSLMEIPRHFSDIFLHTMSRSLSEFHPPILSQLEDTAEIRRKLHAVYTMEYQLYINEVSSVTWTQIGAEGTRKDLGINLAPVSHYFFYHI